MAELSPYKVFWNWVFDGNMESPIPSEPNILKYNSPIHETFILKSCIKHARLNAYLNEWFNNIGIRYIERDELFVFIKQCVRDFKFKRRDIHYATYKARDTLFEKLRKKFPTMKNCDIDLLSKIIQKSDDKDSVYSALGLEKPKKQKLKKRVKKKKVSLKNFIAENFSTVKGTKKEFNI